MSTAWQTDRKVCKIPEWGSQSPLKQVPPKRFHRSNENSYHISFVLYQFWSLIFWISNVTFLWHRLMPSLRQDRSVDLQLPLYSFIHAMFRRPIFGVRNFPIERENHHVTFLWHLHIEKWVYGNLMPALEWIGAISELKTLKRGQKSAAKVFAIPKII